MVENKLQSLFLNMMIKEKKAVTVFLINGVKLQGIIEGYDENSVLLEHKNHRQLVLKHAISTIMPAEPTISYAELLAKG